jgi:hypothetical protein
MQTQTMTLVRVSGSADRSNRVTMPKQTQREGWPEPPLKRAL